MSNIEVFAQHAPANARKMTDHYLIPSHYDFEEEIEAEIERLCMMHDFVTITDDEIAFRRGLDYNNSLPMGNIVAEILLEKAGDVYQGQVLDNGEDFDRSSIDNEDTDCYCVRHDLDEIGVVGSANMEIFTALYSVKEKTSFYFIK